MTTVAYATSTAVVSERALGLACAVTGIVGVASGVVLALVPPMVGPDRFRCPLDAARHVGAQPIFAVQHLGMLAGVVAMLRLSRDRRSRAATGGLYFANLGVVALIGCELLAITARDVASDSDWGGVGGAARTTP